MKRFWAISMILGLLGLSSCTFGDPRQHVASIGLSPEFVKRLATDTIPGDARPELTAQEVNCPTELAAPYDASRLSVGLYWYGPGQPLAPGGVGCRARSDGGAIPGYYDPSKPVFIFVHGWQPGFVVNGQMKDSSFSTRRDNFWYNAGQLNVADLWLKAGWNVAIFHWTQLADDETNLAMPFNSQAKIWTAAYNTDDKETVPTIGMRYRTPEGYTQADAPAVSAGELFYRAYKSALSQWRYSGPEPVRVMGHSLGAQMALALADYAYADPGLPPQQLPARLVLTDPYWTPDVPVPGQNYAYLAPFPSPAAKSAKIAQNVMARGAVIEWLKSSTVLDAGGDNNLALSGLISRSEIFADYLTLDLSAQHDMAPRWYMWTLHMPKRGISAGNSLETARQIMNEHAYYVQTWGRFSVTPADDALYKPYF